MAPTSRELVHQTLNFANPYRAARQVWALPIATDRYPDKWREIKERFPADIGHVGGHCREKGVEKGDMYVVGDAVDRWGCEFHNIQAGVIGEVKDPLVKDWNTDVPKIHVPRELLNIDIDAVNRECAKTEQFTIGGPCPRPFEQLQFVRGSQALYEDLGDPPRAMLEFLKTMHGFYCELLETWGKTDVDAMHFMDDWGSQTALLISPRLWRRIFKPMYKDYCQIAHAAGKKIFFHSDGYILAIYPDLIEIGIDAVNSQLFCMGVEKVAQYAGQITFWGEIDRQYLLSRGTLEEVEQAVQSVHANLWKNGGCFAQMEFGPGTNPDNVIKAFETWAAVLEEVPAR